MFVAWRSWTDILIQLLFFARSCVWMFPSNLLCGKLFSIFLDFFARFKLLRGINGIISCICNINKKVFVYFNFCWGKKRSMRALGAVFEILKLLWNFCIFFWFLKSTIDEYENFIWIWWAIVKWNYFNEAWGCSQWGFKKLNSLQFKENLLLINFSAKRESDSGVVTVFFFETLSRFKGEFQDS